MASARRPGLNQNISTYGAGGFGRDYVEGQWATWESATDRDLVTEQVSEVVHMHHDQAEFNDSARWNGGTYSASYFRIAQSAPGDEPKGIPGAGTRIYATTLSNSACCKIDVPYNCLYDLELSHLNTTGITYTVRAGGDFTCVIGCLLTPPVASATAYGLRVDGHLQTTADIIAEGHARNFLMVTSPGETSMLFSCTSVDANSNGIVIQSGTLKARNCLSTGSGSQEFATLSGGTFLDSNNNASQDATAPGTNTKPNITMTNLYVNAGAGDYHISPLATTDVYGGGADLSADPDFAFDDDIDVETIGVWNVGADSQPVVAGGINITPPPLPLPFAFPVPMITLGAVNITPPPLPLAASFPTPALSLGTLNISPGPLTLPLELPVPSMGFGTSAISPPPLVLPLALPGVTVTPGTLSMAPSPLALPLAFPPPALSFGAGDINPSPLALPLAFPAPTLDKGLLDMQPVPTVLALAFPAPSVLIGAVLLDPPPLVLSLAFPLPAIMLGALDMMPSPVLLETLFPAPTLSGLTDFSPLPVPLALAFPVPTVALGDVQVSPGPLQWSVVFPAPSITGGGMGIVGYTSSVLIAPGGARTLIVPGNA